jgi:hypothetical protein
LTISPTRPSVPPRIAEILVVCRNGRIDPVSLQGRTTTCSGDAASSSFSGPDEAGRFEGSLRVAGRYEAGFKRWFQTENRYEWSNIISFQVVDECRLRAAVVSLTPALPTRKGAPITCSSGEHHGHAILLGDDGSRLALSSSGALAWHYETGYFGVPAFQLVATGYGRTRSDIAYRLGARLSRWVLLASTQTGARRGDVASVASIAPADVSLSHRSGVTRVSVRRGTVVGYRLQLDELVSHIARRCRSRPTLGCLTAIRYRMGKNLRQIEAGKVIRAGGSAVFSRAG